MWKKRNELPGLIKLDIKYDIKKIQSEFKQLENKDWNACVSGPLEHLRQAYGGRLSPLAYGGKTNEQIDDNGKDWKELTYHQMHLTDFDDNFELREKRESGTKWDKSYMKGDKKYDERAYRKLLDDVPPYIKQIAESLGPNRTRVGMAKVVAGGGIDPHRDYDTTFSCRYHVAVKTNEESVFGFEKDGKEYEVHIPADGHLWFVNTGLKHWVYNRNQTEDRTHFIVNMDSQELLENATWIEQYGS